MLHRIEKVANPLLITFVLEKKGDEINLRCRGCRELDGLDSSRVNGIVGWIEFEGESVAVLDAGKWPGAAATEIGHSSCLVVVERPCRGAPCRLAVVVRDLDEVMELAAGDFSRGAPAAISPNLLLILELCEENDRKKCSAGLHCLDAQFGSRFERWDEPLLSGALA